MLRLCQSCLLTSLQSTNARVPEPHTTCTARLAREEYIACCTRDRARDSTLLPHVQDASIKAFRPGSEVVGGPGVAAVNGHASGALRLAQEALPDVCSSKEDAHCGAVQTLALCGNHLCSAGGDAMIRIWDASTLAFLRCACHDFSLLSPSVFYLSSCHWR